MGENLSKVCKGNRSWANIQKIPPSNRNANGTITVFLSYQMPSFHYDKCLQQINTDLWGHFNSQAFHSHCFTGDSVTNGWGLSRTTTTIIKTEPKIHRGNKSHFSTVRSLSVQHRTAPKRKNYFSDNNQTILKLCGYVFLVGNTCTLHLILRWSPTGAAGYYLTGHSAVGSKAYTRLQWRIMTALLIWSS